MGFGRIGGSPDFLQRLASLLQPWLR